jgi:hypothetical protein
MPNHFTPSSAVDQQARRWLAVWCFEAMAHDLRELSRLAEGRTATPSG